MMDSPWSCLSEADLAHLENSIRTKNVVLGFDGCIDTLVYPLKGRTREQAPIYFSDSRDFCSFLANRSGRSACLELQRITEKCGGNMVNVAAAMQGLGANVTCIGSTGEFAAEEIFSSALSKSRLYSVAAPASCTAYEFSDGKLMFAFNETLNALDWQMICSKTGEEALLREYRRADLAAFLNWGELPHTEEIWSGVFALMGDSWKPDASILFDLCDCSGRSEEELQRILSLIRNFSDKVHVILSLNANEYTAVCSCLFKEKAAEIQMKDIREALHAEAIVYHTPHLAAADTAEGSFSVPARVIEHPKCSTGSGDNFNAGFCSAYLCGLGPEKSLAVASMCGYVYVSDGTSADCGLLMDVLHKRK